MSFLTGRLFFFFKDANPFLTLYSIENESQRLVVMNVSSIPSLTLLRGPVQKRIGAGDEMFKRQLRIKEESALPN